MQAHRRMFVSYCKRGLCLARALQEMCDLQYFLVGAMELGCEQMRRSLKGIAPLFKVVLRM